MQEIWEEYEAEFPVRRNIVYLNHAGVSPLCRPAAEAIRRMAADACDFGSLHFDTWLSAYAGVRSLAARLINASPGEIAIIKNTSEGISMIANGLTWRPGDKVVAFREEFPSNYYPWKRLEERSVEVAWLPYNASLDEIDDACRGAKLLAISFVQYLSGYRANLEALGEICHRRGAYFLVDAIQGMSAFPLDVERARIHFLAADGHKWMMGPEGCGVLYVRQEVQDEVEPVEFGWTNVAAFTDYASRDMKLRSDAGRYECGTLNTTGCFGLHAALNFILGVGVERIGNAVQALGDRLDGALRERGCEVLGSRTPQTGAGIVSFRKPGEDPRSTVRRLMDAGFMAAPRQGWVRVSPHFYIPPSDLDRMVDVV